MLTISPPGFTPEQAKRNRRQAGGCLLLMILPFVVLVLVSIPNIRKQSRWQGLENTSSNGRQIWLALEKFRKTYGRYPDATTAAMVKERTGSTWNLKADTANDVFRQLIAAGLIDSETIFQASGKGMRKPDGRMKTEAEALQPGECCFAYIDGPSSGNSGRPMVVAPLIHGTHRFDRSIWDSAVVVRGDGSSVNFQIRPDGTWSGPDGLDLCDPILWDGQTAVVKWPDDPPRASWFDRHRGGCIVGAAVVIMVGFLVIRMARKHRRSPAIA